MQREYKLENWSVVDIPNSPYVPPECKRKCLSGLCPERAQEVYYKIPKEFQEEVIVTSPIHEINGKRITTRSGSIYILGEIDPKYVEYLLSLGI